MNKPAIAMVVMVLAWGTVLAAEGPLESAQQCARVSDSLQRLVCYDRVFAPGSPSAQSAPPVPAPPVNDAAKFGAETLKPAEAERKADAQSTSLTATVREVRQTRPNAYRITLDNGQVWQQMDMDSLFYVAVGDTVQIDRGRMGGYRLARTGKGGSVWVRVNRVK